MLQVVHPVKARIRKMGGNGLVYPVGQIRDGSVTDPGVLDVTHIEPEHVSHAREQCSSKNEGMVGKNLDMEY